MNGVGMNDPYAGYILAAYGVTGATVAALILFAWWQGRARAKRLRQLGEE